ncbi:MAG: tRNA threonylcarbamoyladenosine biosynthesis protein TsaB [Candidatus Binatota bacterium]|nr:tRNA threonylcarbamoyladenosine biosynthesis protein TsaB [Candidatus Binatota bacterium]
MTDAVLGIDTATAVATAGVFAGGRLVSERSDFVPGRHAGRLPDLVSSVLRDAGLDVGDLSGVAVSVGPGSFTGLRVSIGLAQGMAFASATPLVGVSTLEALAAAAPLACGWIAVCLDARKGEVYLALFRRSDDGVERVTADLALPPEAAVCRIELLEGDVAIVGDAAETHGEAFHALAIRAVPFRDVHPRGGIVARLGSGRTPAADPGEVLPRYVRASAAEMAAAERTLTSVKTLE